MLYSDVYSAGRGCFVQVKQDEAWVLFLSCRRVCNTLILTQESGVAPAGTCWLEACHHSIGYIVSNR